MDIIKSSENLSFIFEKLKNLKFETGTRLKPAKNNAVELLILHDLAELIKPAKQDSSLNKENLEKILEADFVLNIKSGKSAKYYNFKKTLESPEYLEHLKALLS